MSLAAPEAAAQSPCGTNIGTSEFAIEQVGTSGASVTIYDRTGTPVAPTTIYDDPNTTGQTTIPLLSGVAGCDTFIGFPPGGRFDRPSGYILFEYTPAFPVTVEFRVLRTVGGSTTSVVLDRFVYGGGPSATLGSFFNPQGGNADVYFRIEPTRVRVSPDDFWTANGNQGRFMDELAPDRGWVFPYHREAFCAVLSCTSTGFADPQDTSSPFVMPVDAVFVYGQPLVKHLTSALSMGISGSNVNWTENWLTLAFAPGTAFALDGPNNRIAGLTLTASDARAGWRGVGLSSGTLVFDGTRVTDVSYDDGSVYKRANSAVRVSGGATLTLRNGAEVSGARMAQGIEATGATVVIEGQLTNVSDNDYTGVVAMPGATVTVRQQAQITGNLGGGVAAWGTNAVVNLDLGRVTGNRGVGAMASGGGTVRTVAPASGGVQTRVSGNSSGLDASDAGSIQMGTYSAKNGTCANCGHLIAGNTPATADFDAHSFGQSAVRAQGNDWNVGDVSCLRLARDGSSTLLVTPLLSTGAPPCALPGGRAAGRASSPQSGTADMQSEGGPALAARGGASSALDAVVEAEDALADGDAAEATALLVGALNEAATADERAGVYGGAARVLAVVQPAALVADIERRATGSDRPWALRVLTVAAASAGHASAATGYAAALAADYAGTEHEAAGLGWLARLAAGADDETGAMAHLVTLWGVAPTSATFAESAAVVAAAFPDADFDWMPASRGTVADAGKVDAGAAVRLAVWPNPTSGAARLSVAVDAGETLDVDVYDGLGRRVAVVAERMTATGAALEVALPTTDLPPGVYLVRVVRHSADGRDTVSVARLTVTR